MKQGNHQSEDSYKSSQHHQIISWWNVFIFFAPCRSLDKTTKSIAAESNGHLSSRTVARRIYICLTSANKSYALEWCIKGIFGVWGMKVAENLNI